MPELRFRIRWPDDATESCYSPSLVIKEYLSPGASYPVREFLERSRTALTIGSALVQAKYGHPCALALTQLARIEAGCARFAALPDARVQVDAFAE